MIEENEKSIKRLKEELNIKNKETRDFKKESEDIHSKFDGVITHFEEMKNKIDTQKKEIENLSKIAEENSKLKKEKDEYAEIVNKSATKEDYLKKKAEDYYDVIVDINSINSLRNEGWEIKYNKNRKKEYQKIIGKQTIKIGVLGLNNVGKSYLLSKIVRIEIPTGYSIETKGISIKYSKEEESDEKNEKKEEENEEEKGICILDSAGFETPLLREVNTN